MELRGKVAAPATAPRTRHVALSVIVVLGTLPLLFGPRGVGVRITEIVCLVEGTMRLGNSS